MRLLSCVVRSVVPSATLCVVAALVLGCGAGVSAPPANSFLQDGTMTGKIHGGNQPISGSTVSLYAAGTSGYGSAGALYAQTTSLNDGSGSFTFTQTTGTSPSGPPSAITSSYACPSGSTTNPDPQMYIVASGGATQGFGNGNNSAAVFAVAIGKCSTVSTLFVDMNEITSVGTMAALQQYFNPVTESFGYPNTAQAIQGFANGVSVIANLVDITTGGANPSMTHSATPLGSTNTVTVTVTPEQQKINLIANILAACVNTTTNTSSPCKTLFAGAVPPTAAYTSQPTQIFTSITTANEDTLQALYFMLTNPTSGASATNMTNLIDLTSSQAPFQPAYTTAPTDWTVGVSFISSNTCALSTPSSSYGTTSAQTFLGSFEAVAVDDSGNIWGQANGTGDLFEISPNGTPLVCTLGTVSAGGGVAGPVIDTNGYVWVPSGTKVGSNFVLYKVNSATGAIDSTWNVGADRAFSVAADGHDNIFYANTTSTSLSDTYDGSVNEFAGAGAIGASNTAITSQKIASVYENQYFMAVDSSDNLWVTVQDTNASVATEGFFLIYPSTNTTGSTYMAGTSFGSNTGFETTNLAASGAFGDTYGVAAGASDIYVGFSGKNSTAANDAAWTILAPGTSGTATATVTAKNLAGANNSLGMAVDGASNVWAPQSGASAGNWVTSSTATASKLFFVSEMSSNGVAISASSTSGGFAKPSAIFPSAMRGIAIDPTGNVWVGVNNTNGTQIAEIVGQAVPVVTPLSIGAKNGTLGAKP
jgi:hypothetical protein